MEKRKREKKSEEIIFEGGTGYSVDSDAAQEKVQRAPPK